MEKSKNLFFLDTGQKTIFAKSSQPIFHQNTNFKAKKQSRNPSTSLLFCSRLVRCSIRTPSFKMLPDLLMNFSKIGTTLLSCLLILTSFCFLVSNMCVDSTIIICFLIFVPDAPVFHSIIASVAYDFQFSFTKEHMFWALYF